MKIFNKVEDEKFGELLAFANDKGSPLFWGKKIKMRFLSREEKELIVAFNLYCFDEDFNSVGWEKEDIDDIKKNVYDMYQVFLNDCQQMEEVFIKEYGAGRDEWDIEEVIETKDDLYTKIQVLQVDIVKGSYIISFLLNNEEWALIKRCRNDMPPFYYLNPRKEAKFAEMDF